MCMYRRETTRERERETRAAQIADVRLSQHTHEVRDTRHESHESREITRSSSGCCPPGNKFSPAWRLWSRRARRDAQLLMLESHQLVNQTALVAAAFWWACETIIRPAARRYFGDGRPCIPLSSACNTHPLSPFNRQRRRTATHDGASPLGA